MTDTNPAPKPDQVHTDHWCEHPECKRWGSFGYSVGKEALRWFCGEHRPDREAQPETSS